MEQNEEKSEFRVSGRLLILKSLQAIESWLPKSAKNMYCKTLKKQNPLKICEKNKYDISDTGKIDWIHLHIAWASIRHFSYVFLFSRKLQCIFANERVTKGKMYIIKLIRWSILIINHWSYHLIHMCPSFYHRRRIQ